MKCNFRETVRKCTFFSGSNLDLKKICNFTNFYVWLSSPKVVLLEQNFRMSRHTVIDWSSFLREVMMNWAFQNSTDEMIGGEGKVVEIDESKMGKRKYNCGRIIDGQWIFGGIERESRKMFIMTVEKRDQKTLLEAIKKKIAPHTTIISDCWKAYACLNEHGFLHQTVNHSENFVDPSTGAHTQNIERSWRDMKSKVPKYGRSEDHWDGYLAEFLFVRKFPDFTQRTHAIFEAIGKLYNPNNRNSAMPNVEAEVQSCE